MTGAPTCARRATRRRNASCYEQPIVELLAPGTVVADRYRLIRKRGSGGVGSVWLARDLSLDSYCGIKLIDCGQANAAELSVRAEREARSAAQLRGAHVVDVFEHGIWNGIPFIAMEFLEGEDLGERLKRVGRLSPEQTYRIVAQIARALVRAHGMGIIHRDLKPDNVFLVPGDEHEVAKLLDFGIAHHEIYSEEIKTTQAGTLIGTPCYLSPEQARGSVVDWRSDLWALGILVFECLTGRPPFASEALGELMLMIVCEPIPPMTRHNPALPSAIDGWWQQVCARDPADRFQSAKQLADSLASALAIQTKLEVPDILPSGLRALGVSTLPVGRRTGASPAQSVPIAESSSANSFGNDALVIPMQRALPFSRRWLVSAAVAAVLAIGAVSTISRANGVEILEKSPELLSRSPSALPVPRIATEPDRAGRPERRDLSPAKRAPVRRTPAPQRSSTPKAKTLRQLDPAGPKEPAGACEHEAAPAEPRKIDGVPDYGI